MKTFFQNFAKTILLLTLICSFQGVNAQTQIGSDINGEAAGDFSGYNVSLSSDGSIMAIGAIYNDGNGTNSGQVRIYKNIAGTWIQVGADIDGEAANDSSGIGVSLSSDGSIVAIGAHSNDGNGIDSGQVRIYKNIANVWTQIGVDIDGEAAGDRSGISVSLSSDGSIVAIGAYWNDANNMEDLNIGQVRVYKNMAGTWTQIGTDIDGEAAGDIFGRTVSLSSDGSIVAIGAPSGDGSGEDSGYVKIYKNNSGVWTQVGANINGDLAYNYSSYGLSLSSDGAIVAIGIPFNNNIKGIRAGKVKIYKNIAGIWTQIGDDIYGEAAEDLSGYSLSLSADGSIVAVGAYKNDGGGVDSGHVRIYKNMAGVWTQIGVDINGEAANDLSGLINFSLSSNGNTVAIGAYGNDGNGIDSGHVKVYDLSLILKNDSFVQSNFSIYPNPTSDMINISLQENLQLEKVNIYNTLGQMVKTEKHNQINVSTLSKGNYFMEVITNQGKATKSFIVD